MSYGGHKICVQVSISEKFENNCPWSMFYSEEKLGAYHHSTEQHK